MSCRNKPEIWVIWWTGRTQDCEWVKHRKQMIEQDEGWTVYACSAFCVLVYDASELVLFHYTLSSDWRSRVILLYLRWTSNQLQPNGCFRILCHSPNWCRITATFSILSKEISEDKKEMKNSSFAAICKTTGCDRLSKFQMLHLNCRTGNRG